MLLFLTTLLIAKTESKIENVDKSIFCKKLNCDRGIENPVCGIRSGEEGYSFKTFKNECELMKYGCESEHNYEYGMINIEYCEKGKRSTNYEAFKPFNGFNDNTTNCFDYDCTKTNLSDKVCGIKQNETGYRIKLFSNKCELFKYNCDNKERFVVTDFFICERSFNDDDTAIKVNITRSIYEVNGRRNSNDSMKVNILNDNVQSIDPKESENTTYKDFIKADIKREPNNIIVINTPIFNNDDFKDGIENFFAATHVFDLPLKVVNNETRRMHLKLAGPVKVFKPWITIPKNISEDFYHAPTLSSCYHKCPTKCPETYAPVCGQPGNVAREPSLVFKNHCYMDYAQCKMRWENKSPTAISSNYIESSFVFCLGDELNGLHRFLPLLRTLQHMGRLKKKGKFRYQMRNMKFFNNMLRREPKLMG